MRHSLRRRIVVAAVCTICCALAPITAYAERAGALQGTVVDPQGAIIARATVSARNVTTNADYLGMTGEDGKYRIEHMAPGTYHVSISYPGFKGFEVRHISIESGELWQVDAKLSVGSASTVVELSPRIGAKRVRGSIPRDVLPPRTLSGESQKSSAPPEGASTTAQQHVSNGDSLYHASDFKAAMAEYREAVRIEPDNFLAHANLGLTLRETGDTEGAITEYREAIRLNPGFPEAHNFLGAALLSRGELDDALSEYRVALRANPGYAEAHFNLGLALLQKNDYDGAIAEYREVVRLQPDHYLAHLNLAALLLRKSDPDAAIAEYRVALRLKPLESRAHLGLARSLDDKGDFASALAEYREAVRLDESSANAHNALAWFLTTARDAGYRNPPQALQHALRAVDLSQGKSSGILDTLAEAYYVNGRLSDAIATEQKALVLKPDDSDLLLRMQKYRAQMAQSSVATINSAVTSPRGFASENNQPAPQSATGPFFALVIGIDHYPNMPGKNLTTAVNDARAVEVELRSQYGFKTRLLIDPNTTRSDILTALTEYRTSISKDASLLIYFAGHGYLDPANDKA